MAHSFWKSKLCMIQIWRWSGHWLSRFRCFIPIWAYWGSALERNMYVKQLRWKSFTLKKNKTLENFLDINFLQNSWKLPRYKNFSWNFEEFLHFEFWNFAFLLQKKYILCIRLSGDQNVLGIFAATLCCIFTRAFTLSDSLRGIYSFLPGDQNVLGIFAYNKQVIMETMYELTGSINLNKVSRSTFFLEIFRPGKFVYRNVAKKVVTISKSSAFLPPG